MKKIANQHRFAAVSALFLLLSACGGGGDAPALLLSAPPAGAPVPTPPPPAPVTINGQVVASFTAADLTTDQGQQATAFGFAEKGADDPTANITKSVANNVVTANVIFNSSGSTFGGMGIEMPVRAADQNQSAATKLQFSIASTGTNKQLKIKLLTSGVTLNGCLPTALVTVTGTLTNYELALNDTNFPLPGYCNGATATNPALAGTLNKVVSVQVNDETFPASGSATSNISVGKVAFGPKPAVPATSALVYGGPFSFGYGAGVSSPTVTDNGTSYTLNGTRTDQTPTDVGAAVAFGIPLSATTDASGWPVFIINLASTGNSQLLILLQSADATDDGCFPAYIATNLTGTAATLSIPFSQFSLAKHPDSNCATPSATRPDTAVAITKLKTIQIRDIKGTTGLNAVSFTVGKSILLSGQ